MKEHEPDTAGRDASLFLQLLSYAFSDNTRGSLDTLNLLVQKYESSTGTPLAEPLKVALVHRGLKDTDVLNHLVMHAGRLNTYALVCQEVRNIMLARATLMNTAGHRCSGQAERQRDGRELETAKARGNASSQREAHEGKRMRTQARMFGASSTGRRDTENVNVANEYVIRGLVRKLSRKTRRLQVVKHTKKRETSGFPCLAWTHCIAVATWTEANSSTVAQHSQHARHSSV